MLVLLLERLYCKVNKFGSDDAQHSACYIHTLVDTCLC